MPVSYPMHPASWDDGRLCAMKGEGRHATHDRKRLVVRLHLRVNQIWSTFWAVWHSSNWVVLLSTIKYEADNPQTLSRIWNRRIWLRAIWRGFPIYSSLIRNCLNPEARSSYLCRMKARTRKSFSTCFSVASVFDRRCHESLPSRVEITMAKSAGYKYRYRGCPVSWRAVSIGPRTTWHSSMIRELRAGYRSNLLCEPFEISAQP